MLFLNSNLVYLIILSTALLACLKDMLAQSYYTQNWTVDITLQTCSVYNIFFSVEVSSIVMVTQVKIPGVMAASLVSFTAHMQNSSMFSWPRPQNITGLWPPVTEFIATTLVPSSIIPSMDFCFSLAPLPVLSLGPRMILMKYMSYNTGSFFVQNHPMVPHFSQSKMQCSWWPIKTYMA